MKKTMVVLAMLMVLGVLMSGSVGAVVGYEDEGAEVGITAIGIEPEEGSDVSATGGAEADEEEQKNGSLPFIVGAGAVLFLGGGTLVLKKRK